MARLSIKKKNYLLITVTALAIIVVYMLIINPTIQKIQHLENSISNDENSINGNITKIQLLQKSITRLKDVTEQMQNMNQVTINKNAELNLITNLEKLAKNNNVAQHLDLTIVDVASQKNIPANKRMPYDKFTFHISGTFQQLITYIYTLQHQSFYILIDEITWSSNKKGIINASFNGRVYLTQNTL